MRAWPLVLLLLAVTRAEAAPKVGWVRASGQLDASTPGRYTPLHLLDGVASTVWCSRGADALSETLSFGFTEPVVLTRVDVTTGNAASDETFHAFTRVRKLLLRGPSGTATLVLEDRPEAQSVPLPKPMRGQAFTLEVLDTFPAEDVLSAACLADFLPFSGTTPLAGAGLAKHLRYQPGSTELLGIWYGGPAGAPDRSLTFFLDGSWRLSPEGPSGRGKPLRGSFWMKAGELWLSIPGMGKVQAHPRLTASEAGGKMTASLTLEGQVGELKQTFRDRR